MRAWLVLGIALGGNPAGPGGRSCARGLGTRLDGGGAPVTLRELAASLQRPRTLDELLAAERVLRRLARLLRGARKADRPRCLARCRGPLAGRLCQARCMRGKTRCRMHGCGGGPKTPEAWAPVREGHTRWLASPEARPVLSKAGTRGASAGHANRRRAQGGRP